MRTTPLALLLLTACVPPPPTTDDAGTGGACPLSDDARALLQQAAQAYGNDAALVGAHMHDEESAYAITLLGDPTRGQAGFAFLMETCDDAFTFAPYCNPDPMSGEQLCLRLVCEAADVLVSEAWWAEADRTEPGDRHPFTTTTRAPAGTAAWAENPYVAWRADLTNPDDVDVAAAIDAAVVITTGAGDEIDATHAGTLSARRQGDDLSIDVALAFTGLGVELHVAETAAHVVSGGVTTDDGAELATAAAGEQGIALSWTGPCAD